MEFRGEGTGIPTHHRTPTFEDHPLGLAADQGDWARVQRVIARRDKANDVWAWKRPSLGAHLEMVQPWLRNPRLVVTFKNPMAVARRKAATSQMPYLDALIVATSTARHAANICSRSQLPLLLINHDAALEQHAQCVDAIARFVGVSDPERLAHALTRIEANREQYRRRRDIVREAREARRPALGERDSDRDLPE